MGKILVVLAVVLAFAVGTFYRPANIAAQNENVQQPLPPQVQRFQIVEIHPSAESHWSALLDTQTGCTWVYAHTSSDSHEWDFVKGAEPAALGTLNSKPNVFEGEQVCASVMNGAVPDKTMSALQH
jgi:hypothetical protein